MTTEPSIGAAEIRRYLSAKSWQQGLVGEVAELWNHDEYPNTTLLVPAVETASD
jgi:hypothetical protein